MFDRLMAIRAIRLQRELSSVAPSTGLIKKSIAPHFIALTVDGMSPRPVRKMISIRHRSYLSHDFSKFAQNAQGEIKAIEALGSALKPGNLLVITSGTGLASGGPGFTQGNRPASEPSGNSLQVRAGSAAGGNERGTCGHCAPAAGTRHAQAGTCAAVDPKYQKVGYKFAYRRQVGRITLN
jgi:hypothetical protein